MSIAPRMEYGYSRQTEAQSARLPLSVRNYYMMDFKECIYMVEALIAKGYN